MTLNLPSNSSFNIGQSASDYLASAFGGSDTPNPAPVIDFTTHYNADPGYFRHWNNTTSFDSLGLKGSNGILGSTQGSTFDVNPISVFNFGDRSSYSWEDSLRQQIQESHVTFVKRQQEIAQKQYQLYQAFFCADPLLANPIPRGDGSIIRAATPSEIQRLNVSPQISEGVRAAWAYQQAGLGDYIPREHYDELQRYEKSIEFIDMGFKRRHYIRETYGHGIGLDSYIGETGDWALGVGLAFADNVFNPAWNGQGNLNDLASIGSPKIIAENTNLNPNLRYESNVFGMQHGQQTGPRLNRFEVVRRPYQERIDPYISGRPDPRFSIDSLTFSSGKETTGDGIRNTKEFWQQWQNLNPESLSKSNRFLINNYQKYRTSPKIDSVWIRAFPEHQDFLGDVLIHHHSSFGRYTIPVPETTHVGSGGIWHGHQPK